MWIRKTITQLNACFSSHYVMLQSDCMATTTPAVTTVHSDYMVTTTVTVQSPQFSPWDSDYWTLTTKHTHHWPGIYYLGANEMATGHPAGNCTLSTWALTRYTKTQSLCRDEVGKDTWFCSWQQVPQAGQNIVTTSAWTSLRASFQHSHPIINTYLSRCWQACVSK